MLVLGAREAIYALDINDIGIKKSAVRTGQQECADADFVFIKMCF